MAGEDLTHEKAALKRYVEASRRPASAEAAAAVEEFFAPEAEINVVLPINRVAGAEGLRDAFLRPLAASFDHLWRSDYIAFGGSYEGREWVTCTGYYTGHFARDWLGIRATGRLMQLRFGEFHRMEGARAVESYVYLDLPELMIAAGEWPIDDSPGRDRGHTGHLPGPVTQDGLVWRVEDPARSAQSAEVVTAMLRKLATPDAAWRPYWREDMIWYGPAAFGSFIGRDHFEGFQVPFENTFSEWIGGSVIGSATRHFARFADGDYICSGGWPSLNAVQAKTFLGQPAEGKRLYMRVCDWWRREGDLLAENWVFVDIPHVLLQMGVDLFPGLHDGG